jgi:hypothetical protein
LETNSKGVFAFDGRPLLNLAIYLRCDAERRPDTIETANTYIDDGDAAAHEKAAPVSIMRRRIRAASTAALSAAAQTISAA